MAPREGLGLVLMKMGRAGPPLSHAAGRMQASLGTPVPRTPTYSSFELVLSTPKLVVYFSKKPLWVEHMPSLNRVNPKVFTSHTILVFLPDNFLLYKFFENEK